MSREERIISKLEFIEYVCENYPQVIIEWKNKNAGAYEAPADADINNPENQSGVAYTDG